MPSRQINQQIAVGVVYVSALFMSVMDTTIVNVALPTIGRTFRIAPTSVNLVSIAYLVSLAVVIPTSGWLSDRLGTKQVLLSAIALFTVASALCGLSGGFAELIVFRVLQGVGGGMLAPVGMAMLYRVFAADERVRAASRLSGPVALAPALGPVLGGLLVSDLSWRWVFYVNLPVGVAALGFGLVFLRGTTRSSCRSFDLSGFVLAASGFALLMYGISEGPSHAWTGAGVVAPVLVGALTLAATVVYELRVEQPLIDFRLLRDPLLGTGSAITLLSYAGLLGVVYGITLFYQDARHLSALQAGLDSFPYAVGVIVGAQIASRVVYRRLGPRRHAAAGNLGVGACTALLLLVGSGTSLWLPRLLLFGMGICLGQVNVSIQAASFATVSGRDMPGASTIFNSVRQLGGAFGVAAFTTVLVALGATHRIDDATVANLEAYHLAFLAAAAAALIAGLLSLGIDDGRAAGTRPSPSDIAPPRRARRPAPHGRRQRRGASMLDSA